jgi:hypothetical protein
MFEYIVNMPFPLKVKDLEVEVESLWTKVAKYNFDPGLEVGEEIVLSDIHFGEWQDKPFSFRAMVVRKEKTVKPHKDGDIFRIDVFVELADKEELERMREILKRLNPGKFED